MIIAIYTILLFLACLVAAPAWMIKMRKRGGWGTGLQQRIGNYSAIDFQAHQHSDYYHAVSVGEAVMALKVIAELAKSNPDYHAVIACTTATGHEIARTQSTQNTLVIYAPLDFPVLLNRLFSKLSPRQVILVDSELWPNLLRYTQKKGIPLKIINGRISDNSYKHFLRFQNLLSPLLQHVTAVCVDGSTQQSRWQALGVSTENTHNVGSLKFDFTASASTPPAEFNEQLQAFPPHDLKILLASTHAAEEQALAEELQKLPLNFLLMVAPRHAERRIEVQTSLETLEYTVTTRTRFSQPSATGAHAFLLDTTGELSRWTGMADIVIVGKSWLAKQGGQNPFEAISQQKLVICGPYMQNFEPLFSEVVSAGGALQLKNIQDLSSRITALNESSDINTIAKTGKKHLKTKLGATQKTSSIIDNQKISS